MDKAIADAHLPGYARDRLAIVNQAEHVRFKPLRRAVWQGTFVWQSPTETVGRLDPLLGTLAKAAEID